MARTSEGHEAPDTCMQSSLRRRLFGIALGLVIPGLGLAESTCPRGTRAQRDACVLEADLVLEETIELPSFTTLNCRGHRIVPSSAGSGDAISSYVASSPAVAIAVTGERRVAIKNCSIGDAAARFDFGIVVMSSKGVGADGHSIKNNEIHARDAGITLLRVDDAEITENEITWTNGCGVAVRRDSDRNRVTHNVLRSGGAAAMPARLVPDGPFTREADQGVAIVPGPTQVLLDVVVRGRLHQFPNLDEGAYPTTEDNVVEGNAIALPGSSVGKDHSGIFVAGTSLRTRVIGNSVTAAGVGVRVAGLGAALTVRRAARCVGPDGTTARHCETDADCFVPDVDLEPVGACPALVEDVLDARGRETFVEGNTLTGPFNSTNPQFRAAISAGIGTVGGIVRANRIVGSGTEAGITLAGNTIESGEVTDNVIDGAGFGLLLSQSGARFFGARVSRNDVVGSVVRAVGVLGTYTLPTELSWDGEGNFWGHLVPPCFGPADTADPSLVQDTHAACAPAATVE